MATPSTPPTTMGPALSSPPSDGGFPQFSKLPFEIRHQIINAHLDQIPSHCAKLHRRGKCCLSPHASINREWQACVEARTFRSLRLDNQDLEDFEQVCQGRRTQLVMKMSFVIYLGDIGAAYWTAPLPDENDTGGSYSRQYRYEFQAAAAIAVTNLFARLFNTLKDWDRDARADQHRLWLQWLIVEQRYMYNVSDRPRRRLIISSSADEPLRLHIPFKAARLNCDFSKLPLVPVIGVLRAKDEMRAGIGNSTAAGLLSRAPNAWGIHCPLTGIFNVTTDHPDYGDAEDAAQVMLSTLPKNLKILRLWCDYTSTGRSTPRYVGFIRALGHSDGRFQALESLTLRNCANVDVFFRCLAPKGRTTAVSSPRWPSLKHLSISGRSDNTFHDRPTAMSDLHLAVAAGLRQLPVLQVLQVRCMYYYGNRLRIVNPFVLYVERRVGGASTPGSGLFDVDWREKDYPEWTTPYYFRDHKPAIPPQSTAILCHNERQPGPEVVAAWKEAIAEAWGCRALGYRWVSRRDRVDNGKFVAWNTD